MGHLVILASLAVVSVDAQLARDPDYEQRMRQLRKETEQLRHENARIRMLNAKGRALLFSAVQLY